MKKLILLLSVVFLTTISLQAQDSQFYLGIGAGYATASGSAADDLEGGINLKLIDVGFRFTENFGITAGLASSGHTLEDIDHNDLVIGVAHFAVGPMLTMPLMDDLSWDFKPQIALRYLGKYSGDSAEAAGLDDVDVTGSAFIIGNSFVYGLGGSQGFAISLDIDYRMGKFTKAEGPGGTSDINDNNELNNLNIGFGLRYNF